ncbi:MULTISPECIES: phosphatase PAP2 family protein [Rhodococcus]|uniref:Phosphatase PAP2 family protein n=2 Tax=Rhodococcus rhodochrous TaxID=1829 RepID=A0AAW4XP41_RHORH|nr:MULTISPECIES: phosphatase PAP2 family protein [Rhodococcus]MCD2114786.1 phosphatase PAP2 family protein [Rhodococcus rhodochrous]WAL44408.1 phosphatase PAP2 family protein [Rhodococcus pyridinivorans]
MVVTESSPPVSPRLVRSMFIPAVGVALVLTLLAAATVPMRDRLYLSVAQTVEGSFLGPLAGLVADKGLLVLVAFTGVLAAWLWRNDRRGFGTLAVGGTGVVGAYLSSELVKLVVTEPRPCRALGIETVLECPEVGDWSWPSNHSVIAASFATACVLAAPRLIWLVAPLAAVLAFSRVTVGVHYVHDVLSGMALGVLVVALVVVVLLPFASRLPILSREAPAVPPTE